MRHTDLGRGEQRVLHAAILVLGLTIVATGLLSLIVPNDSALVGIARDWASSFAWIPIGPDSTER